MTHLVTLTVNLWLVNSLLKASLCSMVPNRNMETVLHEVEKNSFIAFPGKGIHRWLMPSKLPPWSGKWGVIVFNEQGVIIMCTFFWLTGGEVIWEGLPWWLSGKESACNAGDPGLIPGLGRSPGGRHGNPLQYSWLEKSVGRGVWPAPVHRITKSWTRLKWLNGSFSSRGNRDQHHQYFESNQSGICMLVGSIELTSLTWWAFLYLQNGWEDVAEKIIYSPRGRTKCSGL